jgi:hypothetical protein
VADVLTEAQEAAGGFLPGFNPDHGPTLTSEQLLRVNAAVAFLPPDEAWLAMPLAHKRQAIAEIVEFALIGTQHMCGLHKRLSATSEQCRCLPVQAMPFYHAAEHVRKRMRALAHQPSSALTVLVAACFMAAAPPIIPTGRTREGAQRAEAASAVAVAATAASPRGWLPSSAVAERSARRRRPLAQAAGVDDAGDASHNSYGGSGAGVTVRMPTRPAGNPRVAASAGHRRPGAVSAELLSARAAVGVGLAP